jgi:hypothetical protein
MSLIELAERVEKASGPDREIDGIIDRILHKRPKNGDYDETENAIWRVKDGEASGLLVRGDGFARGSFCAASYTASLDAAMTLVPESASWQLGDGFSFAWAVVTLPDEDPMVEPREMSAKAATPALALCAAALRARAQQEQTI